MQMIWRSRDVSAATGYHGGVSDSSSSPAPLVLALFLTAALLPGQQPRAPAPESRPTGERPQESIRPLLLLPKEKVGIETWLKRSGWESKRNSPKRFEVGGRGLRMVSINDSVMIGTERGFPLDPSRFPKIRFTIRVEQNPRGMNLRRKSGEDAAFRLFVAFDHGAGLFRPPNSIAYAWVEKDWRPPVAKGEKPASQPTDKVIKDKVIRSAHYKNVRFIPIGHGKTRAAHFVTIDRDLQADYRRAFPNHRGPVPKLRGVMLKCDSNNTGTRAEAWISRLELIEAAPRDRRKPR